MDINNCTGNLKLTIDLIFGNRGELINLMDYRWIESNEFLLFRGFVRHFHNRNSLESEWYRTHSSML